MDAFEQCIDATSTDWAPWYVIPANHKWVSRALVAKILVDIIQSLGLKYPEVSPDTAQANRSRQEVVGSGEGIVIS